MTLLTSAVNLNILDVRHWIINWSERFYFDKTESWISILREVAEAFYEIAHYWLNASGAAALRAILIKDFKISILTGRKYEFEHFPASDFKDGLRKLMQR